MELDARKRQFLIWYVLEDRFLLGRANLENRIAVLMGGRAAEQLVFDGDVRPEPPTICNAPPKSRSKW